HPVTFRGRPNACPPWRASYRDVATPQPDFLARQRIRKPKDQQIDPYHSILLLSSACNFYMVIYFVEAIYHLSLVLITDMQQEDLLHAHHGQWRQLSRRTTWQYRRAGTGFSAL